MAGCGHFQPVLRKLAAAALATGIVLSPAVASAQYEGVDYVWEGNPAVKAKLEQWQDQKLGFMVHWGTYSQKGWCESWGLCSEDVDWLSPPEPDYQTYYDTYVGLKNTFDPRGFDPAEWARMARDAGMRYFVFTTKHHDGFCMFDTDQTDYKITDAGCPFHDSKYADVTRHLFDAFRSQGFMIGAYFSKPDWHVPWYWSPHWQHCSRNVNYKPLAHPEIWQKFRDFTYAQIEELSTGYGPVDILWLDGAWVVPENRDQDIHMDRIAAMARRHQPGMIVVDRWAGGPYENYRTPEQRVPDEPWEYPWETCMSMAGAWSYYAEDTYKPARELIHILVDVVAKGGNLLLNAGADGNGQFHPDAVSRLKELGAWLSVNGDAIYGTRPVPPYKEGKVCYTRRRDDGAVYAIYLADEGEVLPSTLQLDEVQAEPGEEVRLLGYSEPLQWEPVGHGMRIEIPESVVSSPPCEHAWSIRLGRVRETEPPISVSDLDDWRIVVPEDAPPAATASAQVYRDPEAPVDARVQDLLSRMTPGEKFWQLFMLAGEFQGDESRYADGLFGLQVAADPGSIDVVARMNDIQRHFVEDTRLGIPIIFFAEAVHGLVQRDATIFPQAIGLAASFDTDLMADVAGAIAEECRSRGVRQVLSPVVNIASDPRWGRVEETYGEDPYLSSEMGVAFVAPLEQGGIVTTPKHWIANVGEGGRDSYPVDLDERLLREVHVPPFRACIECGGSRSVMAAYNSVDGAPCTASEWLNGQLLKTEMGFDGFIISDAAAVGGSIVLHYTAGSCADATRQAVESGLDVIFQTSYDHNVPYGRAFREGLIDSARIDDAVARVLRAKFELGLFEHPYVSPAEFPEPGGREHRELARRAARESFVLLKNDGPVLPLSSDIGSIAVIGPEADEVRLGGYTAPATRSCSILKGITERAGSRTDVYHALGCERWEREFESVPSGALSCLKDGEEFEGLLGEYFDNVTLEGEPVVVRVDPVVDFGWTLSSPDPERLWRDFYSVRWAGTLTSPVSGPVRLGVDGNDGYRLYLDGKLLIDDWTKASHRLLTAEVDLEKGREYPIRLEYAEPTGDTKFKLVWDIGVPRNGGAQIEEAVDLASRCEAAVVAVGIEEGEFRDRASLALPGRQEELIKRVAALGKPVVVVLVGGSAVTMTDWLDDVPAVLMAWYPGEEGGRALAEILFGDDGPAGRLPIGFPMSEGQLPFVYNHKPTGRGNDYLDITGQPRFPFGYGLSYTSFEYSGLRVEAAEIEPGESAVATFTLTNTGEREGDEVAQLYVRDLLASVARPVMSLAGFERVHLRPGESREVSLPITADALSMLDQNLEKRIEPGYFRIMVGGSSRDIRLKGLEWVRRASQ